MKYSLLCSANDWMQSKKSRFSIDGRRQGSGRQHKRQTFREKGSKFYIYEGEDV